LKKLTREWVTKAEEDSSVAAGLSRRRKVPANTVCFHCQQSAEKYLKAVLQERNVHFGKTHDLEALLQSAATLEASLILLANDVQLLSDYAVKYRYPGSNATVRQAKDALLALRRIRAAILPLL
jgi:HEPN domain-containing protein